MDIIANLNRIAFSYNVSYVFVKFVSTSKRGKETRGKELLHDWFMAQRGNTHFLLSQPSAPFFRYSVYTNLIYIALGLIYTYDYPHCAIVLCIPRLEATTRDIILMISCIFFFFSFCLL